MVNVQFPTAHVAVSAPLSLVTDWLTQVEPITGIKNIKEIVNAPFGIVPEEVNYIDTCTRRILLQIQAMKTTKMMKKMMRTQNILIINHLLDVTDWKYFKSSPCAASTFSSVASTLASILNK